MTTIQEQTARPDIATVLAEGRKGRRSRTVLKFAIAGLVVIGAAGAIALGVFRAGQPAVRYVTQAAAIGDLTVIVTATGSVQPTNKVDVSSELSGTVRRVFVDFNTPVTIGQTLAELDTDKLNASAESARAKLAAARARVAEAEATVTERENEYQRKRELAQRSVTTIHDFEAAVAAWRRASAALETVRAEVGNAEADLRLNETNLAKASIRSPINGIVLKRNVDPGQTVASSFQAPVLFSIAEDLKKMEVQVDVDEADVGKVKDGQMATFTVDAYPDRKFAARIREVRFGSEIVQGVVTYKAVLTADNAEMLLRPGMTATAEIVVDEVKQALVVPNGALRFTPAADSAQPDGGFLRNLLPGPPRFRPASRPEADGPNRTVWVLHDGNPVAVPVIVGATDGRRTQIGGGGLSRGDAVVLDRVANRR